MSKKKKKQKTFEEHQVILGKFIENENWDEYFNEAVEFEKAHPETISDGSNIGDDDYDDEVIKPDDLIWKYDPVSDTMKQIKFKETRDNYVE